MSGHDSKYFSTTKKGEIPELKEELNSQYKVSALTRFTLFSSCALQRLSIGSRVDPDPGATLLGLQARLLLDLRISAAFLVGFGRVVGWILRRKCTFLSYVGYE